MECRRPNQDVLLLAYKPILNKLEIRSCSNKYGLEGCKEISIAAFENGLNGKLVSHSTSKDKCSTK